MSRFFATGSDSDSDTSSEEEIIQRPLAPVYTFSDDEEEVKRVVRWTKEKRYEELTNFIKQIRNFKKDRSSMLSCFEDLQKAVEALPVIRKEESGQTPRFYTRCLVELEDFINEMWEDLEGPKNLGPGLASMRQELRKYVIEFEEDLTKFRANPDMPDDDEQEEKQDTPTPISEEYSDSIRMLVLLENGEHRIITFTMNRNYTIQEILEEVGLPFHPDSKIECTETNHPIINYLVTVGIQYLENNLTAQYKEDFALYLESLPEFERREVEAQNAPKRKFKNTEKTETNPEKKKKSEVSKKAKEETNIDLKEETTTETKSDISIESVSEKNEVMAIKEEIVKEKEMVIKDEMIIKEENKEPTEEINIATVPEMNTKALQIKAKPKRKTIPEKKKRPKPVKKPKEEVNIEKIIKAQPSQPPISGLILFTRSYKGPLSAKVAWKGLPEPKREEYEEKVKKMRHKYIVQYEQFLRSLSREELFAFSNSRQKDSTDASDSEVKEDSSESDDSSSDIE